MSEQVRKARPKIGFYTDHSDRIRAAYVATRSVLPGATFGEFLEEAVLERVSALEQEYNDGIPWDLAGESAIKSLSQTGVGRWGQPREQSES
ncbi:hypothetical protein [Rhodococcus pyridinivorans]|uniref:hypothetical protein n=1 Tax=Rhodococcus pyridinivorans TaxID=103816 RepID=UPI0009E8E7F8|nr:hypothetical protein [Rhodococcus pyridinivorans]MCD2139767.1 hypothetical protein [Rhodococcus pyridinivorans]